MRRIGVFLVLCLTLLALTSPSGTGPVNPRPYSSAPVGGTDYPWNMFHHDSLRSGATLASAPSTSALMWTYDTGATIYSSPAVVDGTVYISTYNGAVNTGSLYAIDEYSGQPKWSYPTSRPIYASPAVSNGIVYLASRDGFVHALNQQTGQLLWQVGSSNFPITSSPAVANGKIFYGTWCQAALCFQAGQFVARDATTGSLLWPNATVPDAAVISSPSVHNGRVFFGQNDGSVLALDETSGALIWKTATGGNVVVGTAPAVADGRLYVGTANKFIALDEATGATLWTFNTQGNNATSGAVNNGVVYFGTGRGFIRARNATTGLEVWSYDVRSVVSSSPALALGSNTLVVGAHDGYIYALNMTSGVLLWSYQTGSAVSSSPAVADGRVFVGSQDHKVYGLGPIAPALQAFLTASRTTLKPGEVSTLTVTVTNGTDPQSAVTLSFTSTSGGGFTTPIEQISGTYESNYTAPLVTQQIDTGLTVRASKSGYLDDTVFTTITLMPFPPLTVAVTPRPSSVTPGSDILLLIRVSNGTEPVAGASVFLSANGEGSFRDLSDGGSGNYTAVYSAGLQNSSPTLVVQASKPGFSTGQAQVTVTVSGVPDLTNVKVLGIPLFLLLIGLFLLAFVVFVMIVARRKGDQDYEVPYDVSYAFNQGSSREGLSTRFRLGASMGLAAIAGS